MKVDDPNIGGLQSSGLGKANLDRTQGAERSRSPGVRGTGAEGDQVRLSDLSSAIHEASTESPQQADRLERLRLDVQSGRYAVDSRQVSRKLIADALSAGGPTEEPK